VTLTLDHRTKVLIAVVVMVALAAGGWLLGAQPALASAFDALEQRVAVEAQNEASRAELARLEAASKDLPALQDRLAELEASVPAGTDTSELVAGLDGAAASAGVRVDRIAVDAATPYTAPAGDPAATGGEATATDAPEVDPAVVPFSDARITGSNFVVVPVSVDVSGSLDGVLAFVKSVQTGPRLILVNRMTSVADAEGGGADVTATVAGTVYVLLEEGAQGEPAV
jgi:Tfp pilus assembly protein PilO